MEASKPAIGVQWVPTSRGTEEARLDRAMVTGLLLEVIMETSALQEDPDSHRNVVKTRLKNLMATYLAGRVTLQRFRDMLREVDHCFLHYYPLMASYSPYTSTAALERRPEIPTLAAPAPAAHRMIREHLLKDWLDTEVRQLLPQRPHRKLGVSRLLDFLQRTRGGWFRLRDFERHFGVDRKTAWEYLQKFLSADLLRHNHQRSAAVRYALAARFLVVMVDTLGPKIRESLPDLTQSWADQVCDWLVATGGEPFTEADWHVHLNPARCRQIIASLEAAGLLEAAGSKASDALFRLPRTLLQN